jgi:hypothetical protein
VDAALFHKVTMITLWVPHFEQRKRPEIPNPESQAEPISEFG